MIDQLQNISKFWYNKSINSPDDWQSLPILSKRTLFSPFPLSYAELRITSGSTGNPLMVYYSRDAVDSFLRRTIISLNWSKVTNQDVVLNLFAYGNYIPGSMYERALGLMNIPVIPLGAPNTYSKDKIIDVINSLSPSVWCGLPSYLISLLAITDRNKHPRAVIIAGEPLYPKYLSQFQKFNVSVYNHFGTTECPAIAASQNNPQILHSILDGIHVEVDNDMNFIVTDLQNQSFPIIRFMTGDLITIISQSKNNFSNQINSFSLQSRSDDLIKFQGTFISKSSLTKALIEQIPKFSIIFQHENSRDLLELTVPKESEYKIKEIELILSRYKGIKRINFVQNYSQRVTQSQKPIFIQDMREL